MGQVPLKAAMTGEEQGLALASRSCTPPAFFPHPWATTKTIIDTPLFIDTRKSLNLVNELKQSGLYCIVLASCLYEALNGGQQHMLESTLPNNTARMF